MFERLQTFFQNLTTDDDKLMFTPDDPRVAVAALCMQVMEADGVVRQAEKDKLRSLLKDRYNLAEAELDALVRAGKRAENEAIDYYRFTADLKRHLDDSQRLQLVRALWDLVYSDGERSEIEDHVVWRIADLLGVSDHDRVRERLSAAARAEGSGDENAR
ncbi:TerB family tellurite resistance protein [Ciceribacter sp. L1K23]|uniref:tellurite resistance TerB family protein n=1 Tax=Ciceribacter sp. L1K23 TaxID=2820276 RepID=UPI001B831709|nr:TerB family tellurite resistance protein [Ciceribacter sp. L1K23]MBR0554151.1 TerB family tellurite resistance protein [Ciceribacter sp. L1K23]